MLYVEADLSREANVLNEHVEADLSAPSWIIPPSLRNNGLHCVFVQVRKLVGYFSSRVPFSLCRELSGFSHLKQGNGVHPCKAYVSSHNDVTNKRFLNIWVDSLSFVVCNSFCSNNGTWYGRIRSTLNTRCRSRHVGMWS